MEGIYQNNLYSQQSPSYILQSGHQTDHTSYSNYGNPYHRTSAFSDARSYQPNSSASPSNTITATASNSASPYHSTGLSSSNNSNNHYTADFHNHHTNNTHSQHDYGHPASSHSLNWSHSASANSVSWNAVSPPLPPPPSSSHIASRHNSYSSSGSAFPSLMSSTLAVTGHHSNTGTHFPRPKLTTTVWEDESTVCYQVDAKGVCVARRQDNDMINGTKLLNVVGMSRGKRDGILKNEKGRVVVKVGAMHLKGVWITFERARDLATKFKIADILYPLFIDNPSVFLPNQNCSTSNGLPITLPSNHSSLINKVYSTGANNTNNSQSTNNFNSFNLQSWDKPYPSSLPSIHNQSQDQMLIRTQANDNGSCSPVPGTITPILPSATNEQNDLYLINHYDCRNNLNNKSNTARASYSSAQSSTYSLYDNPSGANHHPSFSSSPSFHASPYVQHRKLTQSTLDKEQRKSSIDFPSSPPPENASVKYSTLYSLDNHHSSHQHSWSETTNKSSHETKDTSLNKTSPLVRHVKELAESNLQEKTSRKRMHQDNKCSSQEHKRIRNDKIIASP